MNSPLLEKSLEFATQIVLFYEEFSESKKDTTIAKQYFTTPMNEVLFHIGISRYFT